MLLSVHIINERAYSLYSVVNKHPSSVVDKRSDAICEAVWTQDWLLLALYECVSPYNPIIGAGLCILV